MMVRMEGCEEQTRWRHCLGSLTMARFRLSGSPLGTSYFTTLKNPPDSPPIRRAERSHWVECVTKSLSHSHSLTVCSAFLLINRFQSNCTTLPCREAKTNTWLVNIIFLLSCQSDIGVTWSHQLKQHRSRLLSDSTYTVFTFCPSFLSKF